MGREAEEGVYRPGGRFGVCLCFLSEFTDLNNNHKAIRFQVTAGDKRGGKAHSLCLHTGPR